MEPGQAQWLMWLFGFGCGLVVSVPVAYFLLGMTTSASNTDLDKERWQALCELAILYYSVRDSGGDQSKVDAALARAREVLDR